MKRFSKYLIGVLIAVAILLNACPDRSTTSHAQTTTSNDGFISVPFNADNWVFDLWQSDRPPDGGEATFPSSDKKPIYCQTEKLEECKPALNSDNPEGTFYGEKDALYLRGGAGFVKGLEDFEDGIIEYDFLLKAPIAAFVGALVRAEDATNHERIFMRPHHSNQDDAVQYTPVYNDLQTWQLYYGEGFNDYYTYPYEEWLHAKIVVNDTRAELYIEDMENPALFMPDLKRGVPETSRLGLYALNPARLGGFFANYKYKKVDNPPLKNSSAELPTAPKGSINSWERSEPFDEAFLDGKMVLTDAVLSPFESQWTGMDADRVGITALNTLYTPVDGKNSMFVRKTINSESDQIKILELGYSDRANVFLNGELQYIGNNTYRSRNQAFLGTSGYYDRVALPLKEGENELYMAISANARFTGGWGLMAKFSDTSGISF